MKCALCKNTVKEQEEQYVCEYCSLILLEELVLPEKRPIITHFEDRQQHKPALPRGQ